MLKAIAIDDELPALEVLEAFCERTDQVDLRRTFTRTGEAHAYLQAQPVDLLFLDINMPAQNGIDFVRSLAQPNLAMESQATGRNAELPPEQERRATERIIIFTTAYSQYAVESYTLNAVDYLLKPFSFERFLQAVQKAYDRFMRQQAEADPGHLIFRVDYGLVKVDLAQIRFIEGLDNYLKIHLADQRPVVVRITIKAMLDKLPAPRFVRVHRSYIVALSKVQSVRNKFILIGQEEIPLGSSYETAFFSAFQG